MLLSVGYAKTFKLMSKNETKPFGLSIHCSNDGKAAFVQYNKQAGYLALRLEKFTKSVLTNSNKQPEGYYYEWSELLGDKITGTYGVVEQSGRVTSAWYLRGKDGKKFELIAYQQTEADNELQKLLLHGVIISFTTSSLDETFSFKYANGKSITTDFGSLDSPNAIRSAYVKDYNFDGYDDIAFSLPDAGMGVYQTFNIFLYNPSTKGFKPLQEPNDARAKCTCLCDVSINQKQKLIYTSCRGGARWWQDIYQINKDNKLIYVRSAEKR